MVKQVGNTHRQSKDARTLRRRTASLIGIAALAGALGSAQANTTYTYTPTNSSTDLWSVGTDWNTKPLSGSTTTLTFVGTNTNPVSVNNTNTDDNNGAFQANIINLQGTGPSSGAGSVTIAASGSGAYLDMVNNGGGNPVINLNALAGSGSGLTYNVSAPIKVNTIASNPSLVFGESGTGTLGTATFNFTGGITSSSSTTPVIVNGTGLTMNLSGAASTIADLFETIRGTVNDSADLTVGSLAIRTGTFMNQTAGNVTTGSNGGYIKGTYTLGTGATFSTGSIYVGGGGSTGSTLNVTGGNLNVQSGQQLTVDLNNTGASTGTVDQTGGTVNAGTTSLLINAYSSSSHVGTGLYELNGGTLTVGGITGQAGSSTYGTSTFDFNGGVLKSSATNNVFVRLLTTANVQAGGAIIDTNGFSDTITSNLITDPAVVGGTDGGLTKLGAGTLTLSGTGNSYNGDTTVDAGTLQIDSGFLAATSTVSIASGALMNLSYTGTDTIANLILDGVTMGPGVYSHANDSTYFGNFAGTLTVAGCNIPEPAALGLMGLGGLGILLSGKRRRII